ncbi:MULTISPECIES: class I SAM-dependent methyltransferase [unclassified Micromonospora]|uniref:class I SAM-dependent methyltransferase n=1 Tax=unclassified Micromonospora TaxID=2617518 RepID=UPI001C603C30|nr:class I SAM-dependent methyltransferase [Micromonospora sp. RL09-050-HVF-A]MBW4700577.1 class I SAM-dependent methyltransferase [Micromonospora sp. RL09-050-HVF-A]
MSTKGYAFDNASDQAGAHHDALADLLDGPTRAALGQWGDLTGRRCLEVAAGAGSVALWLAERAAEVVATDVAPQHVPPHPRLVVHRQDVVTDQPPGTFDLVHARLLLGHLPRREEALRRMVAALAPGGVLLIGEFALPPGDFVSSAPDDATADLLTRYLAAHTAALVGSGLDLAWAQRAPAAFAAAGLVEVDSRTTTGRWRGGGPGCRLLRAGIPQLRGSLLAHGLTDADLTATIEAFADPRVVVEGFHFVQISGRVPRLPGPA